MEINRRLLVWVAVASIALFLVAAPLGDSHHGIGKHHAAAAAIGQTLFVMSLLGFVAFLVLAVVALAQFLLRTRRRPA